MACCRLLEEPAPAVKEVIKYVDREVPVEVIKYVDREVIKEVQVPVTQVTLQRFTNKHTSRRTLRAPV